MFGVWLGNKERGKSLYKLLRGSRERHQGLHWSGIVSIRWLGVEANVETWETEQK